MNVNNVMAYVVVAPVGEFDRRTLEGIDGVMPTNYDGDEFDWVAEQLGCEVGKVAVYPLYEFIEQVNDQVEDDLKSSWVSYFYREI